MNVKNTVKDHLDTFLVFQSAYALLSILTLSVRKSILYALIVLMVPGATLITYTLFYNIIMLIESRKAR